jgi:hypothetical protein
MTVSTVKKSHATIPAAWEHKNVVHDSDVRVGAGSIPAVLRIAHTVDAAMVTPSRASSPWMRRYPHVGFSRARRMIVRRVSTAVEGRPGRCG